MELMRTKPLIPNVEGAIHETIFQNSGIDAPGQDMPEINNNGMEVKTNTGMQLSREKMNTDIVMAKKIQASR